MSGDLTARDVIARKLACQYNGEPGDDSGWEYHVDHALELMEMLAAAGWRLERDDQWEWGVRSARTGMVNRMPDEAGARRYAIGWGEAVRRRGSVPPGEWEVAP